MKLKALSLPDLEQVRLWRNEQSEHLRTAFPLTAEMQEEFYRTVICNRQANARYWGIWVEEEQSVASDIDFGGTKIPIDVGVVKRERLIGMGGIENIQWENRLGEISFLLDPYKMEHWEDALYVTLRMGFCHLNLENIFTEVYDFSSLLEIWCEVLYSCHGIAVDLPNRKYYNGDYHNSTYLNFEKAGYMAHADTLP